MVGFAPSTVTVYGFFARLVDSQLGFGIKT
jgi:hypothetical protein